MPLDNMLSGSLQSWLDHELEVRGIDAMVYTRYILSILQTDSFEAELGEADFFPPSRKGTVSASCSIPGVVLTKNYYQKGRNSEKKFTVCQNMDSEQRKKSAAVECLLSVSDEVSLVHSHLGLKLIIKHNSSIKDQMKQAKFAHGRLNGLSDQVMSEI